MQETVVLRIVENARLLADLVFPDNFEHFLREQIRPPRIASPYEPIVAWSGYDGPFPPPETDGESLERIRRGWEAYVTMNARAFMEPILQLAEDLCRLVDQTWVGPTRELGTVLNALLGSETFSWVQRIGLPLSEEKRLRYYELGDKVQPWDPAFPNLHGQLCELTNQLAAALYAQERARQPHPPPTAAGSGDAGQRNAKKLIGWADILAAIGVENSKAIQRQIKRFNEDFDGPIRWVKKRPMVNHAKLLHWWETLEQRASQNREDRRSIAALADANEQARLSFHEERRPNSHGKIR